MKDKKLKKILKEVLSFRVEYFITPLFITLFILSLKYIGLHTFRDIFFNFLLLSEIPLCYFGLKFARGFLLEILVGNFEYYED